MFYFLFLVTLQTFGGVRKGFPFCLPQVDSFQCNQKQPRLTENTPRKKVGGGGGDGNVQFTDIKNWYPFFPKNPHHPFP